MLRASALKSLDPEWERKVEAVGIGMSWGSQRERAGERGPRRRMRPPNTKQEHQKVKKVHAEHFLQECKAEILVSVQGEAE